MAENTLPLSTDGENVPFRSVAINCGIKLVLFVTLGVAVLWLLGWCIDHNDQISRAFGSGWDAIMSTISFGGNLWAAVAMGGLGVVASGWATCVSMKLPDESHRREKGILILIYACGVALWALANLALNTTYDEIGNLSSYQVIGVYAMRASLAIAAIFTILMEFILAT